MVGKKENAGNQHFLFLPPYFLLFLIQITIYHHVYYPS